MRPSIISNEKKCYLCGSTVNLERHHCIHGRGLRDLADRFGLTVYLCSHCHRDGMAGVHGRLANNDRYLKQVAQRAFERKFSHEKWMNVIKRNYL